MSEYHKKNKQTMNRLTTTVMKMLTTQSLNSLTISAVCQKAGLNRGTFYLHYHDLPDLIQSCEDEFFTDLNHDRENLLKNNHIVSTYLTHDEQVVRMLLNVVSHHQKLLKVMLGHNGDSQFKERFHAQLVDMALSGFKEISPLPKAQQILLANYNAGAIMGMITNWVQESRISQEELLHLINQLNHHSFLEVVTNLKKLK